MKSSRQSFLWLSIGAILMIFSNGRWIMPFATWLYLVFFLRFMRLQKPGPGYLLLALTTAGVNMLIWWKMIPFPVVIYFLFSAASMFIFTLSFLADRLLYTRLKGFLSTLVFPLAWCSLEYLFSLTPKGSWQSLGYTQAANLPLLQLSSVTGVWGISFFLTWFASCIHWAWDQHLEWMKIRRGALVFGAITGVVFLFGTLRLNFFESPSQTIRTASIVQAKHINADLNTCKWTDAKGIGQYSEEVENNLLEKTQQAAGAGAKIILWQEGAGFLPKLEVDGFINRAMALAAREKVYLLMSIWSVPEDFPNHLVENKLMVIDPDGTRQLTYLKNNPAPPEPILKGDGLIPTLQTPYGKIAPVICADADYPGFIRQAGKNKVDIIFIPANDWKAIDPIHTHMAILRAIENGFSLVHPSGQGLSVATDNRGRILSSMDFFTTDEQVMYADVPFQHSNTVYAQVGDVFAWLCVAGLITLIVMGNFARYSMRLPGLTVGEGY